MLSVLLLCNKWCRFRALLKKIITKQIKTQASRGETKANFLIRHARLTTAPGPFLICCISEQTTNQWCEALLSDGSRNVAAVFLARLLRIQKFPGSNIGQATGYPHCGFISPSGKIPA